VTCFLQFTSHESRVVSGNAQHYEPPTMRASSEPFLSREDTLERFLLGIAQALMSSKEEELGKEILSRMEKLLGEERIKEVLASPEDARVAVIEGDLFLEAHKEEHDLRALIESIMLDLEKETRRSQYRDKVAALKQAEASGDQTRIDILLKEINQLSAGLS